MYGRASFWPATACSMIGRAMLIGMAKPIPLAFAAIAVLIPMTLPPMSRSGPPLFPGLIAVSVWRRLLIRPLSTSMLRPVADRIPLVTVLVYVPSGLPMAIVVWPTLSAEESPIAAVGRSVASILTMARSVRVSMP